MLESGSSGSVRGVPGNGHPYRDPPPQPGHSLAASHAGRRAAGGSRGRRQPGLSVCQGFGRDYRKVGRPGALHLPPAMGKQHRRGVKQSTPALEKETLRTRC
jgi:hypothetical protein